jgi:hypothetical protein
MWTAEARQCYAWTRKEGLRLTEPEWALLGHRQERVSRVPIGGFLGWGVWA